MGTSCGDGAVIPAVVGVVNVHYAVVLHVQWLGGQPGYTLLAFRSCAFV